MITGRCQSNTVDKFVKCPVRVLCNCWRQIRAHGVVPIKGDHPGGVIIGEAAPSRVIVHEFRAAEKQRACLIFKLFTERFVVLFICLKQIITELGLHSPPLAIDNQTCCDVHFAFEFIGPDVIGVPFANLCVATSISQIRDGGVESGWADCICSVAYLYW